MKKLNITDLLNMTFKEIEKFLNDESVQFYSNYNNYVRHLNKQYDGLIEFTSNKHNDLELKIGHLHVQFLIKYPTPGCFTIHLKLNQTCVKLIQLEYKILDLVNFTSQPYACSNIGNIYFKSRNKKLKELLEKSHLIKLIEQQCLNGISLKKQIVLNFAQPFIKAAYRIDNYTRDSFDDILTKIKDNNKENINLEIDRILNVLEDKFKNNETI